MRSRGYTAGQLEFIEKQRLPLPEESRICRSCEQPLPFSKFRKTVCERGTGLYYSYDCSKCIDLYHNYRLRYVDYFWIMAEQLFRCKLCGINLIPLMNKHNQVCIDHNHETKVIRGALCFSCNRHLVTYLNDPYNKKRSERVRKYMLGELDDDRPSVKSS